uniref:Protein kinase domain-containing protein n=1 Tax=Panagrolaimus superbus TaxID=310955 RepID=A0A914Z751_9BILA
MSIILPLSISLEILGQGFDLKRIWQGRPFYPYIPICILRALKYLHERDIVHKSVKAENCFFDLDGNILLGAFNNVQISNVEEEKSTDIWDLGTTILDHIFQTEEDGFQAQFPDSTSVTQYHSLIQMLDDIGRNDRDPNDNPLPNNDARILTLTAQNHFTYYIPNDSPLCAFLDVILQASNRPTAVFLLEQYGYTN